MNTTQPKFLSRSQASVLFGLSISSIDRALRSKALPSVRIGRRVLIPATALDIISSGDNAKPQGGQYE